MINTIASPGSSNGTGGVTQILPLKLVADKKVCTQSMEHYVRLGTMTDKEHLR